ncbi:MAG: pilus assembly protein CpaE [Intrasporangiaceae bacterium]|nr:pilus assembly protein CpaE [Intrasporangiaceae bacterium]
MIPIDLARELRDAGLLWQPADGDRFFLPDRDMDDRVFTISEMVVEVKTAPVGSIIAFNGTTEWALDAIEQAEAVWIPREHQVREALGDAMLSLVRLEDGWRCTTRTGGHLAESTEETAELAYASALLRLLDAQRTA